ncbi:SdpA family antimicrobial peptide system protein [Streptomyces sp. NPDC059627]
MTALDTDALEAAACRRAFRATGTAVLAFFLLTIFFAMPGNVLTRSWMGGLKSAFTITAPQGWAFFTKSPQSIDLYAYRDSGHGYPSLLKTPQVKPSNYFGLSREQRAQGPELAGLARYVAHWDACPEQQITPCLQAAFGRPVRSVDNDSPTPTLCGDLVLAEQRPTPWAYRNFTKDTTRVQDTVHIRVRCHAKERGR